MFKHIASHDARPIDIAGGDGCYLVDAEGKRYLDLVAGWCVGNVGWNRKEIADAVKKEADRGLYVPQFLGSPEQEAFAARLTAAAPNKELTRVFRCTSGSESVEMAIKCARAFTGKPTIVSVDGVYHGHTYGAAALGDACTPEMGPCPPGFLKIPMPHPAYGAEPGASLKAFEALLRSRDDIAAFITEPVFTNAGAIVPPPDFFPSIEKLCRKHGVLFVMDEVATGFGRCGRLFGSELWGLSPDIICLGKGLTGGFGAMGATLVTEPIFRASRRLPMYSTYGWILTDLAAASANLDIIQRDELWKNAEKVGGHLLERCRSLADLPFVSEVRGMGLVIGIDIRKGDEPDHRRAVSIQDRCADDGILVETAGSAVFLTPPLILTEEQADQGFEVLDKAMRTA